MTPERWRQVDDLLEQSLAQPAGDRTAFIARAAAGDDELRREVEALLAYHLDDDYLAAPAPEVAQLLATKSGLNEALSESYAGRTLGHYRIERQIGRGGMGVVYLAHDTRLNRPVALKLLPAAFAQDAERIRRLQQEARAVSALNHPNILTIYDIGQEQGAFYLAAEFVTGVTLRARLNAGACAVVALDWADQIAAALEAAHQAGIVHRDIKPENVMVRPDGLIKVLDFGLAKLTGVSDDPYQTATSRTGGQTQPGVVLGTVHYMSPEQARGESADARTDLFALGIVLYELLAGYRPFTGPSPGHVLVAIQEETPPPVPQASAAVQNVLERLLAKSPAERFQSAAAVRAALRTLEEQRVADTAEAARRLTARLSVLANLLKRPAWLLALAAVVSLSLGIVLLTRRWPVQRAAFDSIAVLPFANASADARMDYFPDGITESIIRSLSQLPDLRVMARGTVFTYKGRPLDPREIGAALQVRAVVLGRVSHQDNRLVIDVELVNAQDGARLWGEQYLRSTSDLLAVQEEIAREISAKLRLRLTGARQQQFARRATANPEAYQRYLQGRHHFLLFTYQDGVKALDYFNQAIALDPQFALAYTGVSDLYSDFSSQYWPPSEALPRAKEAAQRALELDDTLAEAHHSLAVSRQFADWDWAGAEQSFKRALELNPNLTIAFSNYANLLACLGRFEEARAAAQRGCELDPLSAFAGDILCRVYLYARQPDRVLAESRRLQQVRPDFQWTAGNRALALMQQAKEAEALGEIQQAVAAHRNDSLLALLGYAHARLGHREEALKILAELETQAKQRRVSPVYLSYIYNGLGDKTRALAQLRQALQEHSDHLSGLGVNALYDSLRREPEFAELLRGVGLAR